MPNAGYHVEGAVVREPERAAIWYFRAREQVYQFVRGHLYPPSGLQNIKNKNLGMLLGKAWLPHSGYSPGYSVVGSGCFPSAQSHTSLASWAFVQLSWGRLANFD